jgi:hypothetical protein
VAKRTRLFPRGYPERRGMGAPSDSISEQFVPTETYKAQQKEMAQKLLAAGWTTEQVARLFPAAADADPVDPPSGQEPGNT